MEIRESKVGEVTILRPVDRLDGKTSLIFEQSLGARLKQEDRCFVVDLTEIEFISSAGLRVLLMLSRRLAAAEGSLVLCSLNNQVREVFDIAGLSSVFSIVDSRSLAIKTVGTAAIGPIANLAERLLAGQAVARPARPIDETGSRVAALSEAALELLSTDRAKEMATRE